MFPQVSGSGTEEKYLIATSEQPICAFHKGEWLDESELPLRYVPYHTLVYRTIGCIGCHDRFAKLDCSAEETASGGLGIGSIVESAFRKRIILLFFVVTFVLEYSSFERHLKNFFTLEYSISV